MIVKLVGTNVPTDVLNNLPESQRIKATPEVISAAYARTSRSNKSIDELLKESIENVSKARKSNEAIIYGMGHHSIADHAIFNFNIMDVSRLCVESIEERRIGAGYTEKSQRYVTLRGDYVRPREFSPEDLEKFEKLIELQNAFYFRNNEKLFKHLKKKFPEKKEKSLEGKAKEDARYSLSLATKTQLGCSYTGQAAELAIRKLKNGELEEERELGKLLYETIVEFAPSIIQLADPELFKQHNPGKELNEDNFKYTRKNIETVVDELFKNAKELFQKTEHHFYPISKKSLGEVNLIGHNNPDLQIIIALLHEYSKKDIESCQLLAYSLINNGRAHEFVKDCLKYISKHDKVPRAFETGYLIYEFPISASAFAQLKRHRMNTLLVQDYNPELGYTIPDSIKEIDAEKELIEVCDKSLDLYYEFLPKYGKAAEYCLTNAHKRRVIVACNMRQLYHISRTREDEHAQWEIRGIANGMSKLAKQVAPATSLLLGGKHEFKQIRELLYKN